jgi:acyl carrier protein
VISSGELVTYLEDRLPSYCVPSRIIVTLDLPLSTTGKVDRRALVEGRWTGDDDAKFTAPSTGTEERLSLLWREVLGSARAGPENDFVRDGGNSLRSIDLRARIRDEFGVTLSAAELFERPLLRSIATRIDALMES